VFKISTSVSDTEDYLGQRRLGAATGSLLPPASPSGVAGVGTSTQPCPTGLGEQRGKGKPGWPQGEGKLGGGGTAADDISPFRSVATAQPLCRGTSLGAGRARHPGSSACAEKHVLEKLSQE